MDPRRIDEEYLGRRQGLNPQDPVPCSLGFGGNDGDLFPHKSIDESGFTYIGPPHDGDDARAELTILILQSVLLFSF